MFTEQNIPGLYLINNIIINDKIVEKLDQMNWCHITSNPKSRLVQHYGYIYDYQTGKNNLKCEDIPDFLFEYRDILKKYCVDNGLVDQSYDFNQCIVNNYLVGQGISPHIDSKSFGKVIGSFTVSGSSIMTFKNLNESKEIYVKPNSLYVMSGDSRYIWTHEMKGKNFDIIEDNKIMRTRRISITFRNVPTL